TANSLNFSGGALDTTGTFALSSNRGVTLNAGGGTFVPSSGTTLTYGGIVAGTGALTMAGAGTLTLSGTNTYTGATNINSGTLGVGADANLGTAPGSATANSLNFNGGTLATTSPMTLNSNRGVTLNAGGGTFSPAALTSLTYGGVVAGTGALTVAGAGTLTLSGTNTYTGATNMNSGVLSIGADANLGAAPGSATANSLSFSGGTLSTTATFALNANRGMTVNTGGSPSSISVASGTTLTYGGLVGGSGSLLVPGAGTLDLTNNNLNFAGSATVTSGELELGGTLPSIGTLTLGTGSTLYLNGSDLSVTNLVISGNAIIDFGASASILNATNFTINGSSTLTVKDWADEVDYFYSQNWTGVTLGSRGTGQETHVTFNGYSSSSTGWLSYDKEISPAPEPAAYGAILVGISLLGVVVYRRKCSAA
ncbi:MAG TPA: autotransporter-associated beta strand repeat-containing protein, partial [Opitutaceae bacterium]|nr:autotransporter-associated beta strand repeat-containing protein [Opitutaceae bacterium]